MCHRAVIHFFCSHKLNTYNIEHNHYVYVLLYLPTTNNTKKNAKSDVMEEAEARKIIYDDHEQADDKYNYFATCSSFFSSF